MLEHVFSAYHFGSTYIGSYMSMKTNISTSEIQFKAENAYGN